MRNQAICAIRICSFACQNAIVSIIHTFSGLKRTIYLQYNPLNTIDETIRIKIQNYSCRLCPYDFVPVAPKCLPEAWNKAEVNLSIKYPQLSFLLSKRIKNNIKNIKTMLSTVVSTTENNLFSHQYCSRLF